MRTTTEQNVAFMKLNGAPDVNTYLKSSLLHPIRDYQIQACTDLGIAIASRLAPTVDLHWIKDFPPG
jgi:hypothetical protein